MKTIFYFGIRFILHKYKLATDEHKYTQIVPVLLHLSVLISVPLWLK